MSDSTSLRKQLTFTHVCAIIMGTMIGSGIFKKAAPMAALVGSPELLLGVWIFAGLVTLFGALSLAEVAAMMPETGGHYKYYQRMYGNAFAFISGWSVFAVIQSGSIAAIAYVFSDYTNSVFPLGQCSPELVQQWSLHLPLLGTISVLDNIGCKALSCAVIVSLSYVNIRGVENGGKVSTVFSSLKVLALLAIIALCFSSPGGSVQNFQSSSLTTPSGFALMAALSLALSKAFWAYDGWGSISYVGGEIRDAQKTLPRALFLSVVSVIILYVAINSAYIYILPMSEMAQSSLVAADVCKKVMGSAGASFIALAVMISTLGATNGTILNSARVYFAMAKDRLFFPSMASVHPRFATPHISLIVQALWSCVLVLSGSFETLTDMLIFVSWIYYAMSAYGVFVLRRKMPDAPRPYRVWAYPYVPIVFILVATAFVGSTLWADIYAFQQGSSASIPSLNGLFLSLSGAPLYWYFVRKKNEAQEG